MSQSDFEEYKRIKTEIKNSRLRSKTKESSAAGSKPIPSLEKSALYKRFFYDFSNRCDMLDDTSSEIDKKKMSIAERIHVLYTRACHTPSRKNCTTFFVFISEKLTDRNGHATRLAVNIPYSSAYKACCDEFNALKQRYSNYCSSILDFLNHFKEIAGKGDTDNESIGKARAHNKISKVSIYIAVDAFSENSRFAKEIYNVLISASIFTRIEETKNNAVRNLSSGKLMSSPTATGPVFDANKSLDAPINQLFLDNCARLIRSIIASSHNQSKNEAYDNLLMPVLCDEISKTMLYICGKESLPEKNTLPRSLPVYFLVRCYSTRTTQTGKVRLNQFVLRPLPQVELRPHENTASHHNANKDLHRILDVILSDYKEYVKNDRKLLACQNGLMPPDCPDIFSDLFVIESKAIEMPVTDKEEMRREMNELDTHGGRC